MLFSSFGVQVTDARGVNSVHSSLPSKSEVVASTCAVPPKVGDRPVHVGSNPGSGSGGHQKLRLRTMDERSSDV